MQAKKTDIPAVDSKKYYPPQMEVIPIRGNSAMLVGSGLQDLDPMRSDLLIEDGHYNVASQYTEETSSGWDNFFGD